MAWEWPLTRAETISVLALLIACAAAIPDWIRLLEERGYHARWLFVAVRGFQRVLRPLLAAVVWLLAAYSLWTRRDLWWGALIGAVVCTAGLFWTWVRERMRCLHLWLLSKLVVEPARDHLGVMVAMQAQEDEGEEAGEELLRAVVDLGRDALQVLEVILATYGTLAGRTVTLRPLFVPLVPRTVPRKGQGPGTAAEKRLIVSCDQLKARGFIAALDSYTGKFGVKVVVALAPGLPDRLVPKMLEDVEDELLHRGIHLRHSRESAPPRSEESAWDEEARALPRLTAWLLHLILWERSRRAGGEVFLLDSDLNALAVQFQVSLPKVRQACAELEDAGFLLKFEWRGEDNGIMLVATLAARVDSREVAQELMYALDRRVNTSGGSWG